jgi:tRNA-5-taurinomethyluridine 2-sulfurtransferase
MSSHLILFKSSSCLVVVAMSGGVDSSVTAKLVADQVRSLVWEFALHPELSNQDFDLSAIYMRNWDTYDESGTDTGCEWEKDWEDVQRVCRMLDIPFKLVQSSSPQWNARLSCRICRLT